VPIALQGPTARPVLYERHQPLLDRFWATILELGRLPFTDELDQGGELLAAAGSVRRAFNALPFPDKERDVARVAAIRKDDLLVYLALNIFDRRASFGSIPSAVQRDVKAFFGSYKSALDHGQAALFEAGNAERTRAAVAAANDAHLGVLEADDSDYMFHASSIARQPATIRIILGCAERIEPQPADLDLIKIHGSGQRVSYLSFDNFSERALPLLVRRTIVDLARQRTATVLPRPADGPRVLLGKSHFMPNDAPGRERQASFDAILQKREIFTAPGLGPGYRHLARQLAEAGLVPARSKSQPAEPRLASNAK
jgi:DNA phosphorothioation-associated putative methyltransferase